MNLKRHFDKINRIGFEGKLKPCKIVRQRLPKGLGGMFEWGLLVQGNKVSRNPSVQPKIKITNDKRLGLSKLLTTLAHEMLHYEDWSNRKADKALMSHPRSFIHRHKMLMSKVGEAYGLEHVYFSTYRRGF